MKIAWARWQWFQRRVATLLCLLALSGAFVWLHLNVPVWVSAHLLRWTDGRVTAREIRMEFPMTLVLSDVRLLGAHPAVALECREIRIVPLWCSWPQRLIWLQAVELDGPLVRLQRTAEGAMLGPTVEFRPPAPAGASQRPWRLLVKTLRVGDGTLEFLDHRVEGGFDGRLTDISFVGGPVDLPPTARQLSGALQATVVGYQNFRAPVYCSGWAVWRDREAELSCRLESLALAAFEPYYQGSLKIRVYNATVEATGQLAAQHNDLAGRLQLKLGNLDQADISASGRTIVDFQKLSQDTQQTMHAEVQVSGELDHPRTWHWKMVPGNESVQKLTELLLEHEVRNLRIRIGDQIIPLELSPSADGPMENVELESQQVADQLKIIAPPAPLPPLESLVPPLTEVTAPTEEAPPEEAPPEETPPEATPTQEPAPEPAAAAPTTEPAPPSEDTLPPADTPAPAAPEPPVSSGRVAPPEPEAPPVHEPAP